MKPKEIDEVCSNSNADSITNISANMVNGNDKVRNTCRPKHEWHHANYFVNNYRSNDGNTPRNKSLVTDVDATDVQELDSKTGAKNIDEVEVACNGEDDSDDGNAVGNARGKSCSQLKPFKTKQSYILNHSAQKLYLLIG